MKGRRQVKEGFISFETIIVYVCNSEGEWARQKIEVPLNWVWFECVKTCNAAEFFTHNHFPCVSRMVHHQKDIQPI
jgi:hypothetical protein